MENWEREVKKQEAYEEEQKRKKAYKKAYRESYKNYLLTREWQWFASLNFKMGTDCATAEKIINRWRFIMGTRDHILTAYMGYLTISITLMLICFFGVEIVKDRLSLTYTTRLG